MRTAAYSIDCYDHFCVVFDVSKTFPDLGQDIYILMAYTPGNHSNFKLSDNIDNCELGGEKMELVLKLRCRGEKSDIKFLLNPSTYARNCGPQSNFDLCKCARLGFRTFARKLNSFPTRPVLAFISCACPCILYTEI